MKTKTRGLEPIVAAVLLIVVAVIGAVLVYLWFAGYITKATSQAEQTTASERLKIEAANITLSKNQSYLYIRNLGGDKVTLATAYIFRPGTINPLCTNQSKITNNIINPGELQLVNFTVAGCGLQSGYDYVIKLVTLKGTEFAVTVSAQ